MGIYILKRLVTAIPVLVGVSLIVFLIMAMIPGDPATAILGSYATPENVERLNRQLGLDQPLWQRYFIWLGNLLQGDFGRSFALNRPVLDEVLERFSATLVLAGTAFVLCSILGIAAGVVSAARQNELADKAVTVVVILGISIPSFFLGIMMILLFAVKLRLLPASGMYSVWGGGDLPDLLRHLTMPALALAVVATGVIARLSRGAMLEVLRQDFIRTARAKGVHERRVIWHHALRAAMVGIIPVLGIQAVSCSPAPSISRRFFSGRGWVGCWSIRSSSATSCWCREVSSSSPPAMSASTSLSTWHKACSIRG